MKALLKSFSRSTDTIVAVIAQNHRFVHRTVPRLFTLEAACVTLVLQRNRTMNLLDTVTCYLGGKNENFCWFVYLDLQRP